MMMHIDEINISDANMAIVNDVGKKLIDDARRAFGNTVSATLSRMRR